MDSKNGFEGWEVNGKLQPDPPKEWLTKFEQILVKALTKRKQVKSV